MPIMQRAAALPVRRRLRGDDDAQACPRAMHQYGVFRRLLGCGAGEVGEMTDRRQIADELWEAFKDKWDGEKKFALRVIVKHLKGEQDAVDTPTNSDERGCS
jgi:hypothetical protein